MAHWYLVSSSRNEHAPQMVKVRAASRDEALGRCRPLGFDEHSCVIDEHADDELRHHGTSIAFLFRAAPPLEEAMRRRA